MAVEPKPYLEYLDKEMFIMGILSAFSVAVATLPVEQVLSEKKSPVSQLFIMRDAHVVAGILLALLAAFCFYLQRSHLAWYYGQIALAQSLGEVSPHPIGSWLLQADAWDTWLRYQTGFIALSLSIASYVYAGAKVWFPCLGTISLTWSLILPLTLSGLLVVSRWYCLTAFAQSDNPFQEWMKSLKKSFER